MSVRPAEPLSGSQVRVTVTLDGSPVIDADLTTLYLKSKWSGDDTIVPVWFVPLVPPDEGDEETEATPTPPVWGALRFTIL